MRVEGTFQVDDMEIKLAKTYGEQWVKKRGTDELVMQGHYEEYFVNGIKQSRERYYYNLLEEYFGIRNDVKDEIDNIQMLINPLYLGNLGDSKDWQKLRTFIVKLIGDVNDEEIFKAKPETLVIKQDLLNALGKTDQLKKVYSNDIDTLNNQLVGFDSQVELLEATSNPTDEEVVVAKQVVENITGKIAELKSNSSSDSVAEQLEKEVFELSKTIVAQNEKEFNQYVESNKNDEEHENRARVDMANNKVNSLVSTLTDIQIKKGEVESKIRQFKTQRDTLATQYKEYDTRIKNADNELIKECPTCHRPFEESELATRKDELLKDLIAFKDKVVVEGKEVASKIVDKQNEYNALVKEETSIKDELSKLREELNALNAKTFEKPKFVESKELQDLRAKEKDLKDKLAERKAKASEKATDNYELISKLESDKMNAQKVLDDRSYYERQMTLLDSVKAERKQVSSKLIETEQKREALKTYLYTKLRLLDEHIAKVFGKLRFQLIKENINGGFDPVCKPYIYDVDKDESTATLWKSGSKSEKIITGITIVEAIRKELDLTELPFLFDEGGEISNETLRNKFKTNAQIICVRVEDNINKPIVVKF